MAARQYVFQLDTLRWLAETIKGARTTSPIMVLYLKRLRRGASGEARALLGQVIAELRRNSPTGAESPSPSPPQPDGQPRERRLVPKTHGSNAPPERKRPGEDRGAAEVFKPYAAAQHSPVPGLDQVFGVWRARQASAALAPSLLDMTFGRLRERLPVRSDIRPQPWRLRLPDNHPEACALLFDRRGWTVGPDLTYIVRDVDLATARAVAWAGQA